MPEQEQERVEEEAGFAHEPTGGGSIHIDIGRGHTVEVQVGAPFQETIERIADDAHYGGFFRVFLNGEEILEPTDAPETIQQGMRIALTSYDKVG